MIESLLQLNLLTIVINEQLLYNEGIKRFTGHDISLGCKGHFRLNNDKHLGRKGANGLFLMDG